MKFLLAVLTVTSATEDMDSTFDGSDYEATEHKLQPLIDVRC